YAGVCLNVAPESVAGVLLCCHHAAKAALVIIDDPRLIGNADIGVDHQRECLHAVHSLVSVMLFGMLAPTAPIRRAICACGRLRGVLAIQDQWYLDLKYGSQNVPTGNTFQREWFSRQI